MSIESATTALRLHVRILDRHVTQEARVPVRVQLAFAELRLLLEECVVFPDHETLAPVVASVERLSAEVALVSIAGKPMLGRALAGIGKFVDEVPLVHVHAERRFPTRLLKSNHRVAPVKPQMTRAQRKAPLQKRAVGHVATVKTAPEQEHVKLVVARA